MVSKSLSAPEMGLLACMHPPPLCHRTKDPIPSLQVTDPAVRLARCSMTHTRMSQTKEDTLRLKQRKIFPLKVIRAAQAVSPPCQERVPGPKDILLCDQERVERLHMRLPS